MKRLLLALSTALFIAGSALLSQAQWTGVYNPMMGRTVASSWATVYDPTLNANTAGAWGGFTLITVFNNSLFLASGGTQIRVTITASSGTAIIITNMSVCPGGGSDAYDCGVAPTRLTWSGSNGKTINAGTSAVSDAIAYSINSALPLMVAMDFTSGDMRANATLPSSGSGVYYKSGVTEAMTQDRTGYTDYTATFKVIGIELIERF